MSIRNEQCRKVCRILDDVLANRPTERDALIVAVRTAFDENCPLREAPGKEERPKGRWKRQLVDSGFSADWHCSECGWKTALEEHGYNFCPHCGADMRGG